MGNYKVIEGTLVMSDPVKIAVICSRFNHFIVDQLEAGCVDVLRRHGVAESDITVVKVPGAFELPVVARKLALSGKCDAVIALGVLSAAQHLISITWLAPARAVLRPWPRIAACQ